MFKSIRNVLSLLTLAAICEAANEVKVTNYSFDGTTLKGSLSLLNIAYAKVVNIIYADNAQTWGHTCAATYVSGPDSSNHESWGFNCAIGSSGVTQFYAEYTVNNVKYYDSNGGYGINYQVATIPPVPIVPGFQADITTYLSSALPTFKQLMLANISPKNVANAAAGSIIAAAPGGVNNYVYHWIRDSALVSNVVNTLYAGGDNTLESTLWDHAAFNKKLQNTKTLTSLGEPKFYVDGSAFNSGWCRPQNDGPALRASTFMRFARQYLANGGDKQRVVDLYNSTATGVITSDLDFVIANYNDGNGCDLWEEQRGLHFFTVAVQRRALKEGVEFAKFLGDATTASKYASAASALDTKLASFWSSDKQSVQTTLNGRLLDAAIPLGAVHGDNGDGVFAPQDDRVLKSIFDLESGFISEYTISSTTKDASSLPLSVAIGRYYGDTYDGANNSKGNPWYLCTAIVAETAYRAATAFVKAGSVTVTALNQKLFNGNTPAGLGLSVATGTYKSDSAAFKSIIEGLKAYGDIHIRRVKYHGASGYHLNEQYNRDTGLPQGVNDLTWSYAAMITANAAREELKSLSA